MQNYVVPMRMNFSNIQSQSYIYFLQLLCSYFETTLHLCHGKQLLIELDWRIRIYMYISVTLIHSSKCIESHSRRRWEEVILKSVKRQIGYTSDTYPLLVYYKCCPSGNLIPEFWNFTNDFFNILHDRFFLCNQESFKNSTFYFSQSCNKNELFSLSNRAALELKELKECADV